MPTMASDIVTLAAASANAPGLLAIASTLEAVPRLAIGEAVCREVLALDIYHEDVLELWREGRLRFPFERLWTEIPARGIDPSWAVGMSRVGVVVDASAAERLSLSVCLQSRDGGIVAMDSLVVLTPDGLVVDQERSSDRSARETLAVLVEGLLFFSLRLGLLLTAKNAPLAIDAEIDYSRLNRQRAKAGKPPVLGCRPIRWDLEAIERATGRSPTTEERRRAVAHMVRGHVKIVRGRAHWWKPHYRCVDSGDLPSPRDYDVRRGGGRSEAA